MTTPNTRPRTPTAWIEALDAVRLPVITTDHEKVRRALADNRRSMREIAEAIEGSPVLALHFLRAANHNLGALAKKAESLEVALTRLGLARAATLLAQVPAAEAQALPLALRQLVLVSQHASRQAGGLFGARLARLWQEVHWGSLLFLAPGWALAAAYPALFEQWERRVLGGREPAVRVERELLGMPLLELCLALVERWQLPDWIADGYRLLASNRRLLIKALHIARDNEHPLHQQQLLDADPALRRWLTRPGNSILIANGLALSAHHGWSGVHSLRWQRLAGLYLQLPLPALQQLVHQQAAASAREAAAPGLWHPAQALVLPWNAVYPPAAPRPLPREAAGQWRRLCGELLREPSPFSNVLQLLGTVRQALEACGLNRVLLLQADRTHRRLQAQQAAGLAEGAGKLVLDPAQSPLLTELLEAPKALRLGPGTPTRLPDSLEALFPGGHRLLRSVAVNGRVVMLAIADSGGGPFADTTAQAFDKTLQCLERALAAFVRRPR
ncbi:HDOD domain-containing protein [Stutzerimonas azotifigens]|uniref:HDOD domain-containing protein n=1 Tax=Stutzerimonas azotifigens TaxID=291995 RepID=UPI0003FBDDC0|nr:HDOD domain-containing protein [Stutzerimonas azotifigens]